MRSLRSLARDSDGLATVEYIVGAAVILGTLVAGMSAWNNGLVSRLEGLIAQLQGVR
jgi:Flp pilus assembly pilin Flp